MCVNLSGLDLKVADIIMVRFDCKYMTWRALIAPPFIDEDIPHDHVDYEFEGVLEVLNNEHEFVRRKMEIMEYYPELFALSYNPCAYSLDGTFFHHRQVMIHHGEGRMSDV